MRIRSSIYDFFAYAGPGGLFITLTLWGLNIYEVRQFNFILNRPNFIAIAGLIMCSYVVGHIMSALSSKWAKLFEARHIPELALDEFKNRHANLPIEINSVDWPIWFASIRRESIEIAMEIDRMMATAYFLRGVSLFFILNAILLTEATICGWLHWEYYIIATIFIAFSLIAVKQSIRFNKWFYFGIYEVIISGTESYSLRKNLKETK